MQYIINKRMNAINELQENKVDSSSAGILYNYLHVGIYEHISPVHQGVFSRNKNVINIHATSDYDQIAISVKKIQAFTNPMHDNYLQVIFPCRFSRSTHTSACSNSRV